MELVVSRRVFLTRLGGFTLSLGTMSYWLPRLARAKEPYADGEWLAGDHHIHTKYSPDGQYEIERQIASAVRFGLGWCVITDHGGPRHDKVALAQAYPELVAARAKHAGIHVFQGLEWNVPAAEHGTVILPPTVDEALRIAEFEARFDSKNVSRSFRPPDSEEDAVRAVKYLQELKPRPIFIANHPARRGVNSPHEMRGWHDAGPDVFRGFEGAPGHQAATIIGAPRGLYDKKQSKKSWPGYPKESYHTHGGYDWYVAKIGGVWDSLLGEGRAWYITANSDSHRHHTDMTRVDDLTYGPAGFVSATSQRNKRAENEDFWPGEYSKTWVHAAGTGPIAVLDAIRSGNMFTVHGGLIERLEFSARSVEAACPMGGTLKLDKPGERVDITIRIRPASVPNGGGSVPKLDHIDLIAGDILGPAADRDAMTNPTTRRVARIGASEMTREGEYLVHQHRFENVRRRFYVRLRGTNRDLDGPQEDSNKGNPWEDLWFYSNPVFCLT